MFSKIEFELLSILKRVGVINKDDGSYEFSFHDRYQPIQYWREFFGCYPQYLLTQKKLKELADYHDIPIGYELLKKEYGRQLDSMIAKRSFKYLKILGIAIYKSRFLRSSFRSVNGQLISGEEIAKKNGSITPDLIKRYVQHIAKRAYPTLDVAEFSLSPHAKIRTNIKSKGTVRPIPIKKDMVEIWVREGGTTYVKDGKEYHTGKINWFVYGQFERGQELNEAIDECKKKGLHFNLTGPQYPELPNIPKTEPKVTSTDIFEEYELWNMEDWAM